MKESKWKDIYKVASAALMAYIIVAILIYLIKHFLTP